MAKIVNNGIFTGVYGTGADGSQVRLASLRNEFERMDYAPATCPPKLVELHDIGGKTGRPQTVACFLDLGEEAGQSRIVKVPVMDKAPDIVAALTQAGFDAPPVKIPAAAQIWRMIGNALHPGIR